MMMRMRMMMRMMMMMMMMMLTNNSVLYLGLYNFSQSGTKDNQNQQDAMQVSIVHCTMEHKCTAIVRVQPVWLTNNVLFVKYSYVPLGSTFEPGELSLQ